MDQISFVMMIVVTAVGSSVKGADLTINGSVTQVLSDVKPPDYDSHVDKMKQLLKQHPRAKRSAAYSSSAIDDVQLDDEQNCRSVTEDYIPYVLKLSNKSRYVVQTPDFVQNVKKTECRRRKYEKIQPCFQKIVNDAYCDTKTAAISLYVYDPIVEDMKYENILIPVACVCKFRDDVFY